MKHAIIRWDAIWFENRIPHSFITMYTQLYLKDGSWSVLLEFENPPANDELESIATISFLMQTAPHEILKTGFIFDIVDGSKKIGTCEVF